MTLHNVDEQLTKLVSNLKSRKAGMHSWKTSREETAEDKELRDWLDAILDETRAEVISIRSHLREVIG